MGYGIWNLVWKNVLLFAFLLAHFMNFFLLFVENSVAFVVFCEYFTFLTVRLRLNSAKGLLRRMWNFYFCGFFGFCFRCLFRFLHFWNFTFFVWILTSVYWFAIHLPVCAFLHLIHKTFHNTVKKERRKIY